MRRVLGVLLLLLLWAAPGQAAYLLIAASGNSASGANATTSVGADTTGASTLIIACSWYSATTATIVASDSKGNTWSALAKATSSGAVSSAQLFYVNSSTPTVGSAHTFTCSGTGTFTSIGYQAWSGGAVAPAESNNIGIDGGNAQQPGSLTPTRNGSLLVTALATFNGTTISINGGYTANYTSSFIGGSSEGGAMAYLVQDTAAASNPTWTSAASTDVAAVIAVFRAGIAVSGGLMYRGVSQ